MQSDLPPPAHRPLMVYAFDPSEGRSIGNCITIRVPYESLQPGPRCPYFNIVDYDATNGRYYKPVNLDDPTILLQGGLLPTESDPRFHQQMVYAVARSTIHEFERALGRRVKCGYRLKQPLRVFPHAMQEANAYYDRNLGALIFGYFSASAEDIGSNLRNQTVFTCLSHDIIAHETTHAILDNQRPYFMQDTNPDVSAFHEAFSDIVALFQHFTFKDALYETMVRTGGMIFRNQVGPLLKPQGGSATLSVELEQPNPLIGLARQFGEATGRRAALRSALGHAPSSRALETTFEPHERGAILVAAVFDAYFSSFVRNTADLFRIARAGGVYTDEIHPSHAERLSREAGKLARRFLTICIRAIDYCPPVDITFGDYLRALITADSDLFPDDPHEYRHAFIEAFRLRGIHPEDVISMAEDSLRWSGPRQKGPPPVCKGLDFDPIGPEAQKQNYIRLSQFGQQFAKQLYLLKIDERKPFVNAFHPIRTVDGPSQVELVTELMQRIEVRLDPKDKTSPMVRVYGGSTVHFNVDGTVRYVIHKSLANPDRLERMREYWEGKRSSRTALAYVKRARVQDTLDTTINFAAVHRGL